VKRGLLAALAALALAAPAQAGGPALLVGAAEDAVKQQTLPAAKAQMDLARLAGFGIVRVTEIWAPGETALPQSEVDVLRNTIVAGKLDGLQVVVTVMNYGSRTTPLSGQDRTDFASFAASIPQALPNIRTIVVGNEPNLNRFWLPQFDLDGTDAAARDYEALLAQTYDALKAVSPKITVLGGALSPRGGDDPNAPRLTHSPTRFILDLGAFYRASGRAAPIMDALDIHPYEDNSSVDPVTSVHPNSTTIAIADYAKLVSLLGQAFDGTNQRGTTLPIWYGEFGVETQIPAAKASLYTGTEPSTVHPVDEATQAKYYREALQLAFCAPTVRALLFFHVGDETDLNRWQSGLYYADGTPKPSVSAVRTAIDQTRRGVVARCPDLHLTPHAQGTLTARGLRLTCDIDCAYVVRRGRRALLGHAIGGTPKLVRLRGIRVGERVQVRVTATVNPGPPRVLVVTR
jgi:hypothetical protein